ncbi:MAG: YncE family protein [Bacteroidetes bacterium]|nr:YncE family protein [Bacteroidota bacterium]
MRKSILFICILFIAGLIIYSGCRKDLPVIDVRDSKYPEKIGTIILTKCAVSGCHNTQSKDASAGLDLSTWDKLFEGSRSGAVCIPYSHDFSTLFLFTNTYDDLGGKSTPTMPLNADPLTHDEEVELRNWIDAGAPDANGFVKWSDNSHRKKYYVTQQGCDKVCSIDPESGLQMRYIDVGADAAVESPHLIKLSPDSQYWYCSFIAGRYLEKHRTSDDALVGRILLGPTDSAAVGSWNTFAMTSDGHYAYVVDWSTNGRIARVDLQNMIWLQTYQGSGLFTQPHGSFVSPDNNTLYVTTTSGNFIYKVDVSLPQLPSVNQVIIDGSPFPINTSSEDGHDITFSPDGTKYYITCQKSNKVRVMDAATDQLIATIPVGVYPQEFAISTSTPYLYVTCQEDTATYPGMRGSVYVLNYQTNTFVASVYSGWQPHGIVVDDDQQRVIVANRNIFPGGPAPHHTTSCGGRNGYITEIDMSSNTLISGSKRELIADPYTCAYRRR